jgi:outer membrane protein assembly factor BamD
VLAMVVAGCGESTQTTRTDTTSTLEMRFEQGRNAYLKGEYTEAIRLFEEVRIMGPGSPLARDATFLQAMSRFQQGTYAASANDFKTVRKNFASSPVAERAQYMVGESYYRLSPRPELDQSYSLYAVPEFQSFLRDFPNAPQSLRDSAQMRIKELRNKLARKVFLSGELYTKMEEPKSALVYFERVLDQYYDTDSAPEAQLRIAEVQFARKRNAEAATALDKFDAKYLQEASQEQRQRAMQLRQKLNV